MGEPDPENQPGSRTGALSWSDATGNLWLYGGNRYDTASFSGICNDLWRFDRESQTWTWAGGSIYFQQSPSYEVLGQFHKNNNPGKRTKQVTWTDGEGNLWLFGSNGSDGWDIWKYDLQIGQWACMRNNGRFGVPESHGIQGVPAHTNNPGTRNSPAVWQDSEHRLWVMGGNSFRNDLWCFDTITLMWTWVKGSPDYHAPGVYGELGVPDSQNTPGSRYEAAHWTDNDGNFWLYGGTGRTTSTETFGSLNDMWKFDPRTDMWTWMGGTTNVNEESNHGAMGVAGPLNSPGSRSVPITWADNNNGLWLLGGSPRSSNDLWHYSVETKMWTWIKGSPDYGSTVSHGELGVPAESNDPGPRAGSSAWVDHLNNLYMYGGRTYGNVSYTNVYNDVWRIALPANSGVAWDESTVY